MKTPNSAAGTTGRIRTPMFIGLVIVSVCTILVVLYGFKLAHKADQFRIPAGVRNRPKHHGGKNNNNAHQNLHDDTHGNGGGPVIYNAGDEDDEVSSDELIEISPENLKEFESAINSMKSTLREIRAPMANRKVDPLLAAHPNHRLIYHDLHKADREHSLFVSLTSYYDTSCKQTVRALFDNAKDDEDRFRIFIGVVQVSTPVPPHTTTLEPLQGQPAPPLAVEPLPEHSFDSCLGDSHLTDCAESPFCASDNVRLRDIPNSKWQGHAHARYLTISMYRSENYVLFLDRRATRVTMDWHNFLEQEFIATTVAAGHKRIVLTSHLPTVDVAPVLLHGDEHHQNQTSTTTTASSSSGAHQKDKEHHHDGLFHREPTCTSEPMISEGHKMPSILTVGADVFKPSSDEAFVQTPLVSGSFVFGSGKILLETLTDSTPWLSMTARDWQLSAALYNAGYDAFVTRKMVFATEKGVHGNANETALELAHSSEVEDGEKQTFAFVEGRKKLIPVKAMGGGGVYSGNIMMSEDVVIPASEHHRDAAEFSKKVAEKAMKKMNLCSEYHH